ncbi:MAG: hypothetical protein OEY50_02275 [Nitrospinota bacterium]|nr:hypothetical protein [Nitrospinota bacterium]MDH5755287.1 hypothetical protein [Nitrospinota bacterium]
MFPLMAYAMALAVWAPMATGAMAASQEDEALKYNVRGAAAASGNNYTRALRLHQLALQARLAADDIAGAIMEFHNIAVDFMRLGNIPQAQSRLAAAVEIFEQETKMGMGREKETAMQDAMARITILNAIINLDSADPATAEQWATQAMEHCRKAKCALMGRILNVMGRVAVAQGTLDKGRTLATEALVENKKSKDQEETANSFRLMGEIAETEGDAEKANEAYLLALGLDRDLKIGRKIAMDLLGLARGYRLQKETGQARLFATRALIVANAAGYENGAIAASELLQEIQASP